MSVSASSTAEGLSEFEKELDDLQQEGKDQEISPVPVSLDYLYPGHEDAWNVYICGEALENGLLQEPNFDMINFMVTTGEEEYPENSNRFPDFESRQYIESFLLEKGIRDSFEEVAEALLDPAGSDLWERENGGAIPIDQEFTHEGGNFRVFKEEHRDKSGGPVYPVPDYFERAGRPGKGIQTGLSELRQNLRPEDCHPFKKVVEELRENGATMYVTGSILDNSSYDDIDIAVEALHEPKNTHINRTDEGPYPQRSNYQGLPGRLSFRQNELVHALEDIEGIDSMEIHSRNQTYERGGYSALASRITFSLDGTDFDIGYDEEPFVDDHSSQNPLELEPETVYTKI